MIKIIRQSRLYAVAFSVSAPFTWRYMSGTWFSSLFIPTHYGLRGRLIMLSSCFRAVVLSHFEDTGLRGLSTGHLFAVREVPMGSSEILRDMDGHEDYRALVGSG